MSLLSKTLNWFGLTPVGSGNGNNLSAATYGNPPPAHYPWNWWQAGFDLHDDFRAKPNPETSALVRGAVDTIVTKIAAMPLIHERRDTPDGVFKAVNGGTQAILDNPCPGMTQSDWTAHMVSEMVYFGNSFHAIQHDPATGRPMRLHPLPPRTQILIADGGELFFEAPFLYAAGIFPEPLIEGRAHIFPERHISHVRVIDPQNPFVGKSPLAACGIAINLDYTAKAHATAFLNNQHRPSGFLSTEERLTREQIQMLRTAFETQSKGMNQGRIPVLGDGLKYQQLTQDHTIEISQVTSVSARDISAALRVPLPFLGVLDNANFSNIAALEAHFVSGLRYYLRNIEETLKQTFKLGPNDRFRFDFEAAIAPPSLKDRIEALGVATRSGIMTLNEARRMLPENLSPKDGADTLLVQGQMRRLEDVVTPPPTPEPPALPAPEETIDQEDLAKMLRSEVHNKSLH